MAAQVHDGVGLQRNGDSGFIEFKAGIATILGDADVDIDFRAQSTADAGRHKGPVIPVGWNDHLAGRDQLKQALRVHAFTLGNHLHRFGQVSLFVGFHLRGHGRAVPPADVEK
jgi:hypothetical protein